MILRNVFVNEGERIIRAIVIDSPPPYADTSISFGTFIENSLQAYLSQFTKNKRVYKIEDAGVLVGYYIIDYNSSGDPMLVSQKLREAYAGQTQEVTEQVVLWAAQETAIKIFP